jgi:hypothetical protein
VTAPEGLVEAVARAIDRVTFGEAEPHGWQDWRGEADAAIEAVREWDAIHGHHRECPVCVCSCQEVNP